MISATTSLWCILVYIYILLFIHSYSIHQARFCLVCSPKLSSALSVPQLLPWSGVYEWCWCLCDDKNDQILYAHNNIHTFKCLYRVFLLVLLPFFHLLTFLSLLRHFLMPFRKKKIFIFMNFVLYENILFFFLLSFPLILALVVVAALLLLLLFVTRATASQPQNRWQIRQVKGVLL